MIAPRTIAFVLFDNALALDVSGPAEVFSTASRLAPQSPAYALRYLSTHGGLVRTASGFAIETEPLAALDLPSLDTVVAVGGLTFAAAAEDDVMIDWIRRAAAVARRACSVCTGAFVLGAAGLLDGRRAVTHWSAVDHLRALCPRAQIELDPIYVRDGPIWTSAGVTAGIDLALALVIADHGERLGLAVAKELVVFLHRSGGQAQFSRALAAQSGLDARGHASRLDRLQTFIVEHLSDDLSVERLASWSGMTPRTFARRFAERFACTPAKLVEDLRLDSACRRLETGAVSVKQIATACGFGDEERMRRAFMRRFGASPATYRARFAAPGDPPAPGASA